MQHMGDGAFFHIRAANDLGPVRSAVTALARALERLEAGDYAEAARWASVAADLSCASSEADMLV
jgi:hypothetical protein